MSMKLLVLAGGLSPEREVSLSSGSLIAAALVRKGWEVCLADVYTGLTPDGKPPVFSGKAVQPYSVPAAVPDLERLKAETGRGECRIGPGIEALCREADAVFIALHGDVGENGQLQAFLDMACIPYTGSGYIGSLLSMDKDLTKQILTRASVLTPDWVLCHVEDGLSAVCDKVERHMGFPVVIKPCTGGSSVGVSMPENRAELEAAVQEAAALEPMIMAERRIFGRELSVSILNGTVLPPVEIIPHGGFYDYEHKYQAGTTEEICPASLTARENEALTAATKAGFSALRLRGYARFDYILDDDGKAWCLEANALPGMTPTSLLPRAAAAVGMGYDTLCETIVRAALEP